jgi:hypothetical protein
VTQWQIWPDMASIVPTPPTVRYAASEKLEIKFLDAKPTTPAVARARVAFLSQIENHIRIVDGRLPEPWTGTGPIEVIVAESLASKSYAAG